MSLLYKLFGIPKTSEEYLDNERKLNNQKVIVSYYAAVIDESPVGGAELLEVKMELCSYDEKKRFLLKRAYLGIICPSLGIDNTDHQYRKKFIYMENRIKEKAKGLNLEVEVKDRVYL